MGAKPANVRGELQHPTRTDIQGRTVKGTLPLLESVPLGVTTWTVPVVAPISLVPRILAAAPTLPTKDSFPQTAPDPEKG
jgi:hypothetical protein